MIGIRPAGTWAERPIFRVGRASLDAAIPDRQPALRHRLSERGGAPRRGARARHRRPPPRGGRRPAEVARGADADVLGMAGGDGSLAAVAEVAIEQDVRSSASRSGRATTSRATSASTATTRSARSPPSTATSGGSTSAGRRPALPEQRLARPLRAARPPARAPPPPPRSARPLRALALPATAPAAAQFVHDRRRAGAARGRPRREQRLQPRPALDRRAGAAGRGAAPPLHPARLPADHLGRADLHRARDRRAAASLRAAIDGEPVELETPLEFRIEPGALRVLVPRATERISTKVSNASSSAPGSSSARTSAARRGRRRPALPPP